MVANLTRAMAVQLAPHNIRVNAIVLNKIGLPVGKDEFDSSRPVPNMAKRPGEPAEAAKAVLFLVTDDLILRLGRQPVRRWRRLGDGFVVIFSAERRKKERQENAASAANAAPKSGNHNTALTVRSDPISAKTATT